MKRLSDIDGTTDKAVEYAYVARVTEIVPNEVVQNAVDVNLVNDVINVTMPVGQARYRVRVSAEFELRDADKKVLRDGIIRTAYSPASENMRTMSEVLEWVNVIAQVGVLRYKSELAGHQPSADALAALLATDERARQVELV